MEQKTKTRKVPPKGSPEYREYSRTKKQESRDREYARRNKTIEAWRAVREREVRVGRNLYFYGEQSSGVDAKTCAAELQIHREFLRAMDQPDVQPGESLRSVAKRTYEHWLAHPLAGCQPGEIYVPAFSRMAQRFDPDYGFQVSGKPFEQLWTSPNCDADEPIDVTALPPLPRTQ